MKKTIFRCQECLKSSFKKVAFLGFFVMLFTAFSLNVQAQNGNVASAQGRQLSNKHNASLIAQNLGITVHTLGGWDVNKVIQVLTDRLHSIDQNSSNPLVRFQYVYYASALQDVRDYSVAPEISLILRLIDAKVKIKQGGPSMSYLTSFYTNLTGNL